MLSKQQTQFEEVVCSAVSVDVLLLQKIPLRKCAITHAKNILVFTVHVITHLFPRNLLNIIFQKFSMKPRQTMVRLYFQIMTAPLNTLFCTCFCYYYRTLKIPQNTGEKALHCVRVHEQVQGYSSREGLTV